MTSKKSVVAVLLGCFLAGGLAWAGNQAPEPNRAAQVELILKNSCSRCHSGAYPSQSLNLEPGKWQTYTLNVPSRQNPEYRLIDLQQPLKSYLLLKIRGDSGINGKPMPMDGKTLSDSEITLITRWIINAAADLSTGTETPAGDTAGSKKKKTIEVFPATRQINLNTTAMLGKNQFLFLLSHRFQPSVKTGYQTFFGMDGPTSTYLHLGYGITDRVNIAVGRTNTAQALNLGLKWLAFDNREKSSHPIAAALSLGATINTQESTTTEFEENRVKYHLSLGISYRANRRLAFIVTPMFATNVNHWVENSESTLALGLGVRFTAVRRLALIAEWIPVLSGYKDHYSGWGLGLEYPIGKHVFQVFMLNSLGLIPDQIVAGGDLNLGDGDFRFGFSIHRLF